MEAETLAKAIETIEARFKMNYTAKDQDEIWESVLSEPAAAMRAVWTRLDRYQSLPTASQLVGMVRHESRRLVMADAEEREAVWAEEKGADTLGRVDGNPIEGLKHCKLSDVGRKSVDYIHAVLAGEKTMDERLQWYKDMERDHPGLGFEKSGMLLSKEADKQ